MLGPDGIGYKGPVQMAAKSIQLALAMNRLTPAISSPVAVRHLLALTGPRRPAKRPSKRAAKAEIKRAIEGAKSRDEQVFPIPPATPWRQSASTLKRVR